tara:strand:+ start:2285 stop:3586 length:1302 start_codon:yes stop_codon:yes gene_type:complete
MPQGFGTLSQLNATGGIEKYLIDSPSLTFWRFQHLKYTNFAVDNVEHPLTQTGANKAYVDIERQGDLISNMYLQVDSAGLKGAGDQPFYIDSIGQMIIKQCVLQIGGQCVQDISGAYMYAWEELSGKSGKFLKEMTGKYGDAANLQAHSKTSRRHYVPIPFWFTQTSGSALPLISLQFHRLKVMFTFETDISKLIHAGGNGDDDWGIRAGHEAGSANWMVSGSAPTGSDAHDKKPTFNKLFNFSLLTSYVYLSQEERQRFADGSFEYLITQVQEQVLNDKSAQGSNETLNFNHSVLELIWAIENPKGTANDKQEPFGGCQIDNMEYDTVENVSLKFNNHDRLDAGQPGAYYRLVQPYQHHSRIPSQKIYCYNFGLHPEEAQPSGAVNMSRIDKITFNARCSKDVSKDSIFHLWARNYNVLKIENGLGGQMYAS